MLIYFDMCCLKRPFDDQSQPRIRLETEAVLQLLALEPERVRFVRSTALVLENSYNPLPERAARVDDWLRREPPWLPPDAAALQQRIDALCQLGLKSFDALHLAAAEQAGADRFVTVDVRLLNAAARRISPITVAACSVLDLAKELLT